MSDKFKKGDRVYVKKSSKEFHTNPKIIEKIVTILEKHCIENAYRIKEAIKSPWVREEDLVLESIYNSTLYQALNEND